MAVTEKKVLETRTKNVSAQFSMLSNLFYSSGNDDMEIDSYFSTLADDIAGVF